MSTQPHAIEFPAVHRVQRFRSALMVAMVLLAGACLLMLASGGTDRVDTSAPAVNSVVHWQDSRHNWLLVADRDARQLVVYDAATGEPLQRLGRERGLGHVKTIAALGDHLLVQDAEGQPTLLSLPELQTRALAAR